MCLKPRLSFFSRWRKSCLGVLKSSRSKKKDQQDLSSSLSDAGLAVYEKTDPASAHGPEKVLGSHMAISAHEQDMCSVDEPYKLEEDFANAAVGGELSGSLRAELRKIHHQLRMARRARRRSRPGVLSKSFQEENIFEAAHFRMRCKLFTFDRESQQWRQRGTGDITLLRHKTTGRTRLRVCGTKADHRILADHDIDPDMVLTPGARCDRSWLWHVAAGVSETEPETCGVAVRFGSAADAMCFRDAFEEARAHHLDSYAADVSRMVLYDEEHEDWDVWDAGIETGGKELRRPRSRLEMIRGIMDG